MSIQPRGQWKSKLGFVLAASGSAIGLGNVVFFGSNAYSYGFGAFYLPYLIALSSSAFRCSSPSSGWAV